MTQWFARMHARVRDKLREFYAESGHEPVIISLPKGTYTPVFYGSNRNGRDSRRGDARASCSKISARRPWYWLTVPALIGLILAESAGGRVVRRFVSAANYSVNAVSGGESDPNSRRMETSGLHAMESARPRATGCLAQGCAQRSRAPSHRYSSSRCRAQSCVVAGWKRNRFRTRRMGRSDHSECGRICRVSSGGSGAQSLGQRPQPEMGLSRTLCFDHGWKAAGHH
jgi:hypothetical protein